MKSVGDYDLSRRKTMDSLWLDGQKSGPGSEKKKTFISFSGPLRVNKKTVTSQVHLKIKGDYDLSRGKTIDSIWYQDLEPEVIFLLLLFHEFSYQSSLDNSLASIFISISHLHEIKECLTLKISWRLKCDIGGNQKLFLFNLLNFELQNFLIWHGNFVK